MITETTVGSVIVGEAAVYNVAQFVFKYKVSTKRDMHFIHWNTNRN